MSYIDKSRQTVRGQTKTLQVTITNNNKTHRARLRCLLYPARSAIIVKSGCKVIVMMNRDDEVGMMLHALSQFSYVVLRCLSLGHSFASDIQVRPAFSRQPLLSPSREITRENWASVHEMLFFVTTD